MFWLRQAKARFGLCALDYTVTYNHIHLLVHGTGRGVIPRSMQLIAGRTAQEFNRRKGRRGAFWEDRYHATAVESDEHLARCVAYIDLNMVRAGVVAHPQDWAYGGYRAIQSPPKRYNIIDRRMLTSLLGAEDSNSLAAACKEWVESELRNGQIKREAHWTESVAVGSKRFVTDVQSRLGTKATGRVVVEFGSTTVLREPHNPYHYDFEAKMDG